MKLSSLAIITMSGMLALSQANAKGNHEHDHAHDHQQDADKTENAIKIQAIKVTDQITMLQSGKGGNVAVMTGDEGIVMVDDEYEVVSPSLKAALKKHFDTESPAYIINTHWHGDHTEGNKSISPKAAIVAHDNVRKRLSKRQEVKLFNMVSEPYSKAALPSITYNKTMTLHLNGETVEVEHYAKGHTDGDSIVFFKNNNVVHMGDHYFAGMYPFVDVDSKGNVANMAVNISEVIEKINDKTKVIPGHGGLSNKAELQAYQAMLVGTHAEVEAMMKKGMSLEKIQKKGLSKKWASWGKGFINEPTWIGIVYSSLQAGR